MFAAVHRLIFSREQSSVTVLGELVCIHIHTISIVEQSLLQTSLAYFIGFPKHLEIAWYQLGLRIQQVFVNSAKQK